MHVILVTAEGDSLLFLCRTFHECMCVSRRWRHGLGMILGFSAHGSRQTALLCNDVSHWLGTIHESALSDVISSNFPKIVYWCRRRLRKTSEKSISYFQHAAPTRECALYFGSQCSIRHVRWVNTQCGHCNLSITTTSKINFITCDLLCFNGACGNQFKLANNFCLWPPRWAPEGREVSHSVVVIDRFYCTHSFCLGSTKSYWV